MFELIKANFVRGVAIGLGLVFGLFAGFVLLALVRIAML